MIEAATDASKDVGVKEACIGFGVSPSTFYRRQHPPPQLPAASKKNARRLSPQEEIEVLNVLTSDRFVDESVPEIHATLLDEGVYMCSSRTMYRILNKHGAVKERRNQLHHPEYSKPELLANNPNEVWSWDITKLKGPKKWSYHYLYVIMDIYSRCVVGWMFAPRESASLAEKLIEETCQAQGIQKEQLTLHADRGTAMRSKLVAQLLADLGITKTHSRPYTSNDNPYSEAQFKTLKYHRKFPGSFGSLEDARSYLRDFFDWYNKRHKHSGIGYHTPESLHLGNAHKIREKRAGVLQTAYQKHPERFVKGLPQPPEIPKAAWINKPMKLAA